jgi:hypothetical protein
MLMRQREALTAAGAARAKFTHGSWWLDFAGPTTSVVWKSSPWQRARRIPLEVVWSGNELRHLAAA